MDKLERIFDHIMMVVMIVLMLLVTIMATTGIVLIIHALITEMWVC